MDHRDAHPGERPDVSSVERPGDGPADDLLVVSRFRVDEGDEETFGTAAQAALAALAARPGYVAGRVGRNLDDPGLWLVSTTWANVGSYRRALSAYDVKVTAVPLLSRAVDEPSAYERVREGSPTNTAVPRELGGPRGH